MLCYDVPMRTTLTIDDRLAEVLKRRALETGQSFKAVVNEALRAGLERADALPRPKAYRLEPLPLGQPRPDINLDKAVALAGELEDAELARKMQLRK